ncbi:MAG: hypothetical protein WAV07_09100 [Candidatus Contendobacter sp.]
MTPRPSILLAEHAENEARKNFTVNEWVEIGRAVEAALGQRQGQRTDLANENQFGLLGEIPVILPEFNTGESREIAAKKAGFDSEATYRRAKIVVEHTVPELVAAMDRGDLSVSTAATLTELPASEQARARMLAAKALPWAIRQRAHGRPKGYDYADHHPLPRAAVPAMHRAPHGDLSHAGAHLVTPSLHRDMARQHPERAQRRSVALQRPVPVAG